MKVQRPLVAVSACLLGEKVRYDGEHKRNPIVLGPLAEQLEYLPFCPEVGIGLPVPRPALELVQGESGVHVTGVTDRTLDVTDALHAYAHEMATQWDVICGVIFKCRSPSCGLTSVALHDAHGKVIGTTSGAFAADIVAAHPGLPLTEEEALLEPQQRKSFIHRVMARYAAR